MRSLALSALLPILATLCALVAGCANGLFGPGAVTVDPLDETPDPELAGVSAVSHLLAEEDIEDPTTGACTGIVTDRSGNALGGATLELKRIDALEFTGVTATAGSAGEYGFADVPPGQFTIGVSSDGMVSNYGVGIGADALSRLDVQTL
jgi:hypothetical protein